MPINIYKEAPLCLFFTRAAATHYIRRFLERPSREALVNLDDIYVRILYVYPPDEALVYFPIFFFLMVYSFVFFNIIITNSATQFNIVNYACDYI